MNVGFVGLGKMGQGMTRRILGGGHDLVVYNRTTEKAADLAGAGATIATSIADACRGREVVITMVADDTAVKEVTVGAGGLRDSLAAGAVRGSRKRRTRAVLPMPAEPAISTVEHSPVRMRW